RLANDLDQLHYSLGSSRSCVDGVSSRSSGPQYSRSISAGYFKLNTKALPRGVIARYPPTALRDSAARRTDRGSRVRWGAAKKECPEEPRLRSSAGNGSRPDP